VGDKMSEVNKFAPELNVQWHFQDIPLIFSAIASGGCLCINFHLGKSRHKVWFGAMGLDRGLR